MQIRSAASFALSAVRAMSVVGMPATMKISAMPRPIVPEPTTPAARISRGEPLPTLLRGGGMISPRSS